ncbi:MAG: hypothetical protein ABJA02_07155 [Acidobacteriota bacterium]
MDTRFLWELCKTVRSVWNVYRWRATIAAAAFAFAVLQPADGSAQIRENSIAFNQPAKVIYTECESYTCSSAIYSPEQVVQKISAAQRSAIVNKDCKGLRSEFGKNLEAFPFEFRDTDLIDCIDDRPMRLWMTDNNYRRFLANKDNVTSVAEYHDHLRSIGYTSKKLLGQ